MVNALQFCDTWPVSALKLRSKWSHRLSVRHSNPRVARWARGLRQSCEQPAPALTAMRSDDNKPGMPFVMYQQRESCLFAFANKLTTSRSRQTSQLSLAI